MTTPTTAPHSSAERPRPRVVLIRPADVETDSRAKKLALSLTRLGYDAVVLGRSGVWERRDGRLGAARITLLVPRSRVRGNPIRLLRLPVSRLRWFERLVNIGLQRTERRVDKWRRARDREGDYLWRAAQRDFRTTYGGELERLRPEVIHVHDPRLLPLAFRSAERVRRRTGNRCVVVYDARENFAGVPEENITLRRYHDLLLQHERALAPRAAAMLTVSQDTADALDARLALPRKPFVVLNAPVEGANPAGEQRSLRRDTGTGPGTPLLVYQGAATAARGVDTMVEALPLLPGVHVALVVVPFPHPRAADLVALAERLGVADRLHLLPPVPADAVPLYLRGADVAVSPILRGPANHEAALPNKLFEMLHSGLPIVTSDVRAMSAFVREHGIGLVFRSGDPEDLARAVHEVLADPATYRDPQRRAELMQQWSWQGQEASLAQAYALACPTSAPVDDDAFPAVEVEWEEPPAD
ncbi:MAG: glycosyltransferase family 4 protein [Actinomycetes bacterium]